MKREFSIVTMSSDGCELVEDTAQSIDELLELLGNYDLEVPQWLEGQLCIARRGWSHMMRDGGSGVAFVACTYKGKE